VLGTRCQQHIYLGTVDFWISGSTCISDERERDGERERERERERDVRIKSYNFFRPRWALNLRPVTKRTDVLSVLLSETARA
jgi:hypothetical protein